MPKRKNRPDKFGIGKLNAREIAALNRWFRDPAVYRDQRIALDGGVVHYRDGFDSGDGEIVRGLVTKGILEPCQGAPAGFRPRPGATWPIGLRPPQSASIAGAPYAGQHACTHPFEDPNEDIW